MYWPDREDVQRYYPQCFQKYKNVIGIIDCTDCGKGPKPNHSTYKPRNTWKKVIGITSAGTILFISKSYGGCASDQFITGDCHVLDKLQYSDNLMADKGFSFIDLLISKESQYFTLFERETTSFKEKLQKYIGHCKSQNTCRASNCTDKRLSNFEWGISNKHEGLTWWYLLICAATTNLAPLLVPLSIKMKQDLVSMMYSFLF